MGHDPAAEFTIDIQPSCTEEGSRSKHCTRCDERSEITAMSPLGHSSDYWEKDQFYHIGACERCHIDVKEYHTLRDHNCTVCEQYLAFTDGLRYSDRGEVCGVAGIGSATDKDIVIAPIYNGKPVTVVDSYAFYGCNTITSVRFPERVKTIGQNAFAGCTYLANVAFPDGITSIGENAFYRCASLVNVTIPDGITNIASKTFSGCTSLANVVFPENLTSIGESAFYQCTSLANVTFPDGITKIDSGAFSGCTALTSIVVPDGIQSIFSNSFFNCPIETATIPAAACQAVKNSALKTLTITGGNAIPNNAFERLESLTSVTILGNVTSIGYSAFYGCSSLANVTILETVTDIKSQAFDGCAIETASIPVALRNTFKTFALKTLTITGDEAIPNYAFERWESLTSVTILGNVTSIGYQAFYGCSSLERVTISDSVTSIGYQAFSGCSSLTSVTVPETVTSIGEGAFRGCAELVTVHWNPTKCELSRVSQNLFLGVFSNCSKLTNVKFGESVTNIPDYAFSGSALANITIPESINGIGEGAFYNCASLESITFFDSVKNIGSRAFSGCSSLTSITLPDGVTNIESSAFSGCSSLTSVTMLGNVTSIGSSAFSGCASLAGLTLPDSLTSIGVSAFSGCSSFVSVTIPERLTSIGRHAFYNCTGLTEVLWNAVECVSEGASTYNPVFAECNQLTKVRCAGNVKTIPDYAFKDCVSLTDLHVSSLTHKISFGTESFAGCTGLQSISFGVVNTIGERAFAWCSNITSIRIVSIGIIENEAFLGDRNLNSINYTGPMSVWNSIVGLGNLMKYANSDKRLYINNQEVSGDLTMPADVTKIGNFAYYGCGGLTGVTIPDGVANIGKGAFENCTNLVRVSLPADLATIGESAFGQCNAIENIHYRGDVASYFAIDGLKNLTLYGKYDKSYFIDGSKMENELVIPASVTSSIASEAFRGHEFTKVIYQGTMENWCKIQGLYSLLSSTKNSGYQLTINGTVVSGLPSLTMPCVNEIAPGAFRGCRISELIIPEGVTKIGSSAFTDCMIKKVTIPSSVTYIGSSAFEGWIHKTDLDEIVYNGTMEQWNAIEKGKDWDLNTGNYTVRCTDGNIVKGS